jgi:hypothetical protein
LGRFFPVLVAWAIALLAAALLTPLLTPLMPVHLPGTSLIAPLLIAPLAAALALLRDRLVHQVEDTEVVLGILQVAFSHHAVATAGRVAAELQVFLEQLLRRAADPDVRAIAVEYVVAVERDATRHMVAHSAAATAATTPAATPARAMVAATHAFHVHNVAVVLSRCVAALGAREPAIVGAPRE